ncbi:hypothetical protein DPMN_111186 [Dreissena polymorpha]|uniref:Uncharacterized protein n=1 Tax=Dreissena polymorpha TaxID=45954 RepID=A0A9D4KDD4_DREPO|nr:hypothetical protein DPMN_111186 [Dreissena polymorpha]
MTGITQNYPCIQTLLTTATSCTVSSSMVDISTKHLPVEMPWSTPVVAVNTSETTQSTYQAGRNRSTRWLLATCSALCKGCHLFTSK